MRRLTIALLGAMVALSGCTLPGHGPRTYRADFARAVQVTVWSSDLLLPKLNSTPQWRA